MWRIPRYLFCTVRGFDMNRYLQERKGRWYFRIRVPKMLQPHLNTEISYPIWGIDIPTPETNANELPIYNYNLWNNDKNSSSSRKDNQRSLIVAIEFAACFALCLGLHHRRTDRGQ